MQKQGEAAVFIAWLNFIARLSIPLTCLFFASLCSFCRNWYCSIFIHYEIQLLLTSESKTFDLNRLFIIFFSWIMLDLLLSSSPASAVWGLCILQLIGLAGTTRSSVKILLPISVRSSRTVYKFTRKLPGKPRTSPWSPAVFRPEGLWPCWCAFRPTQEKACMLWSMNSADVLELGPPVSEYPQRDLIQFIW